jgi:hypothetical protein
MVPAKLEFAPIPAAPFTCQKTFSGSASPVRVTSLPAAVLRAAATWKIKIAPESPSPSRIISPVREKAAAVE